MSYIKTTWAKGDVVTSAKLNNMEDGIEAIDTAQSSAFAPDITNPQGGEILIYDSTSSKWVNYDKSNDDFIITCTPTAQDFSGTCDKSVYEVYEAFQAGKNIKLKTTQEGVDSYTQPITINVITYNNATFATLTWILMYTALDTNYLIECYTNAIGGGYSTRLYNITSLKPAVPD